MKNKILYNISLFCGLVPLTGGLFIFFTWWIARAYFAIVKGKFTTQYLTLPSIEKGQCAQLYIDKEFKLIEKWE